MQEAVSERDQDVHRSRRAEIPRLILLRASPLLLGAAGVLALAGFSAAALATALACAASAAYAAAALLVARREEMAATAPKALEEQVRYWRQRAEWLDTALRSMPAPVVVIDEKGRPQVFNAAAIKMLGVGPTDDPPSEWAKRYGTFYDDMVTSYPSEKLPIVRALHGEAADEPDMFLRNPRQEGLWVSASARPLRDEHGALQGAVLVCHDMTERRRAEDEIRRLNAGLEDRVRERTASLEEANRRLALESDERDQVAEALRSSQQLLELIVERSSIVLYVKDTASRYLLVNPSYERLFHVRAEDLLGKSDLDHFPAELAEILQANDRRVIEEKRALQFEEVVLQDGELHTYVTEKFPLFDAEGNVHALCGISTDITERKRMEADLRRSEASLSAMIESISDAVWSIDKNHRLLAANAALRTAYQKTFGEDLLEEQNLEERAHGHLSMFADLYRRVFAGESVHSEQRFEVGGSVRHFLISIYPIFEGDEVTGATGFSRDITELRQTEELARRNQAELTHVLRLGTMGEIASALAHEINQPLGAISNYASACARWLDAGSVPERDLRRGLELIAAEALRAGEIIRRLRDLGRKGDGSMQTLDANDVVRRAADLMRPELQLQGISLEIDTAEDLGPVYVDGIQIEQVLLNLFLNSVEAMQDASVKILKLGTSRSDGCVQISVRDTGVGLNATLVNDVFEPFFTTKQKGLGMGLAISRRIIEAHGGHLRGVPNPDGGGSTFSFTLPLAQ